MNAGDMFLAAIMALESTRSAAKFSPAVLGALLWFAAGTSAAQDTAYNLSFDTDRWTDEFSVFQMSASDEFGLIRSSMATSDDPRLKAVTRLDSSWNFSAPVLRTPARLGDTVSSSYFWDEPLRMGGVQLGTIQPATPDVVAPPVLLVPDLALTSASAAVASSQIINRVHVVAQLQTQILAPAGQGDYSLEMGKVREDFELRSNNYGSWLTSGTYRYGVTAATTLDGQFAQVGLQQSIAGVGLLQGLGTLGSLSANFANSRDADSTGWLARLGYDYSHDKMSFAVRSHIQSASYQSVSDSVQAEPLRQRTLASAGMDLGAFGKLSVASATQTLADDTRRDVLAVSHAMPLVGGGIISTAAAYSPGPWAGSALLLSVTYPFDYQTLSTHKLTKAADVSIDRTIMDAFNQTRIPPSGHIFTDRLQVQ